MDERILSIANVAYLENHRADLNDNRFGNMFLASKVSQAVWGDKHFNDVKPIEFTIPDYDDDPDIIAERRAEKMLQTLKDLGIYTEVDNNGNSE